MLWLEDRWPVVSKSPTGCTLVRMRVFFCAQSHMCLCLVQWRSAGKFLKFLHQSLCHLLAVIPAVCSSSITPLAFHHEVLPLPEFLPWSSTSSFKSLSSSKETDPPPVVLPGLWQPDFVPSSYLTPLTRCPWISWCPQPASKNLLRNLVITTSQWMLCPYPWAYTRETLGT